jgi:recombinational DNA repair ATPase RecF
MDSERVKITNVSVRNIKRISIANVAIDKDVLVIGGNNAQGKSSFCDAICMALGGAKLCPPVPLREGEDSGEVEVELNGDNPRLPGKNIVRRTFSRKKDGGIRSEMKIESAEGYDAAEPQTILNSLVTASTWDPTEFLDKPDKKQFEYLRQLLGVDTSKLDADRERAYSERTIVNRRVKEKAEKLKGSKAIKDADIPDEVSVIELADQRDKLRESVRNHNGIKTRILEMQEQGQLLARDIERLETQLADKRDERDNLIAKIANLQQSVKSFDVDESIANGQALSKQIANAEKINQGRVTLLTEQRRQQELRAELKAARTEADRLTDKIDGIDDRKDQLMRDIDWPVAGMSFGDGQVLFNDVPLSQASSAQQLKVSVGIDLTRDRPLPLLIIKNGSHLDADHLQAVVEIANEKGAQVFIERVGKGNECDVVFEDGMIEEARVPA